MLQDIEAVTNGVKLPWSNGRTEGQVNRLKFIERQMLVRAHFDLLRRRVPGYHLALGMGSRLMRENQCMLLKTHNVAS